jgi:hypothetical protein
MTHLLVITVVLELLRAIEKLSGTHILRQAEGLAGEIFTLTLPHGTVLADAMTLAFLTVTVALSAAAFRLIEVPSRDYFAGLAQRLRRREGVPRWRPATAAAE